MFCIFLCFLSFIAGFVGPFASMITKHIINLVSTGNVDNLTLPITLIVINFIIFDNITWRGIAYIRYKTLHLIAIKADKVILNNTLKHSVQFFQNQMAGTLTKQIFHLVDVIATFISNVACNFIKMTSLILVTFIFAYNVNVIFFYILMSWSVLFFSISFLMGKKIRTLSEDLSKKSSILG